jgi:hypothetical protein
VDDTVSVIAGGEYCQYISDRLGVETSFLLLDTEIKYPRATCLECGVALEPNTCTSIFLGVKL